uniref:NWD1/2-like winged helix-turn-helix domain-containing protein n=1 Tax=Myripristis murdjan TaxID=586833 RepID=A0A667ZX35_9TELE
FVHTRLQQHNGHIPSCCSRCVHMAVLQALVGHQYGSGSLPGRVEVAEYQQLLQQSQRAGGGTRPLERLYRRNENTEPPSYRLQPHTQVITLSCGMKDKEEELKVFQSAVSLCVQEGLMTPEKAHSYYRSGEVAFATPDQSSALMKPSDEHLLSQLCDNFLPGFITSCHLLVYTTTTECDRRHGYTSARRRGYAESLCQQVYADLLGLIDSWIGRDSTESPCASRVSHLGDALAREWAEQEELCALLSRFYDIVRAYVEQKDRQCSLVVTGGPCTGKTVLIAHCAQQVHGFPTVPEPDPNLSPVLDPDLSYKRRITNQCFRPNLSLPHLKEHLSSLLSLLPSPQQPLVLILDGLDQIKKNYRPQIIQCLPCPLPPEVKLILTLCANKKDCVQVEPRRGYVCVELNPVDRKQRANMLASLLSGSRRRVTSGQQALLNRALTSCSLTLYARLLHIHTSLWSSDSEVAESSLPDGVHSSISALLDHLEQKHGFPLVTRALSYLTLSRTGLTEAELTDLLSIDDEVLAQYVHQGDAPPSKMRVPQVDVERLLLDLKSFLIRRTVGVTQVLFWVSRHFELVLGKRYLGSHEVRKEIHSAMVDYFSGRWACGRAKPLPVSQESGANKATTAVSTRDQMKIYLDRQPAGQPFVFKSSETSTSSSKEAGRVNLRKILELPHHLQESNRWEELEQGLMMSLGFHQAMACAGRVGELVAMLEWKEGSPQLPLSRERALLASILKSSACLLQSSPLDLPTVIETRLLPYLGVYPELEGYIREIRQERRKTGSGIGVVLCPAPSAVPSIQCLPGDGGTKKVFVSEAVASECGTVVEVKSDGSVWIWKACGCDVVELSLNREQNKLKFAGVKSSGRFILLLTHCNKLFLWDMQDLDMLLEVKDPLKTEVTPHTLSKIEGFVACQEKFCVCWKGESFVSVFDLSTEPLTHFQCPSPVTCVICSSSGSYMYCGQEKGIVSIFDISTYSLLGTCSNPNENAVRSIILCEDKWEMSCIDSIGNISLWSVEAKTQGPFLVKESFSGGNTTKILSTDYSYNIDTLLLCEAHQISLWDTCKWELWDQFLAPQGRTFTQAALTQDGPLFLALLDTCPLVMVWRISTGECVLSLDTGANTQPLTLLRAATNVVSITHDGCLTAWDSEMIYAAGTAPKMGSGVVEVVAEPMGDWFYVTDRSEMVWRWSLQAETPDANFLHDGPVEKLCLSPDNIQLVTLSAGEIYIWQTETGQNTVRIRGSKAKDILVTPNSNIGVSLVERGLSQVWKLANGGIVCHIHLYLAEAQVSPESTFLFGLRHGDLLAASLWSGSISKRFSCAEWSEHVVAFHMLPEHPDFVVVMAASGAVYTWKVTEETVCRHFQLPYTVHCQPQVFQISSNGNYALLSIDDNVITFMDLSQPRLSSLKAEGPVLKACLEKNGCYAVYITHTTTLGNGCVCDLHSKPLLITVRLADGGRVGRVCLCKNPLTLDVCEQLYVFVGFEDGSVGVYYIPDIVRNGGSVRRKENLIGQKKQFPCDREPLRCLPMAVPNVLWP